jgi:hypothetical protein
MKTKSKQLSAKQSQAWKSYFTLISQQRPLRERRDIIEIIWFLNAGSPRDRHLKVLRELIRVLSGFDSAQFKYLLRTSARITKNLTQKAGAR